MNGDLSMLKSELSGLKGKQYFEHLQSPSGITYSKEVCC